MGGRGIPMLFGAKSLPFVSLDPPEQPRRWQPREAPSGDGHDEISESMQTRGPLWSGRLGCISAHPRSAGAMIGRAAFDVVRFRACGRLSIVRAAQRHTGQPREAPWGDGHDEISESMRTRRNCRASFQLALSTARDCSQDGRSTMGHGFLRAGDCSAIVERASSLHVRTRTRARIRVGGVFTASLPHYFTPVPPPLGPKMRIPGIFE